MALMKKRTPVKVPPEMERAVQQIYDDLNDIINSVNVFALSGEESAGKPGDMRVIKDQSGSAITYYLQIKSDDGWVQLEGSLVG
tara:strand:- start:20 stop:271 length:252 start_codon:yes stop_codon:yes gene_type:complete